MTINLEKSLEIEAPLQEVFEQWADMATYPRFMPHVLEARPLQDNRWIWETQSQEWEVEITEQLPQESISWRISTPDHTGTATVHFADLGGSRTKVVYAAHYSNGLGPRHTAADVAADMAQSLVRFARSLHGDLAEEGEEYAEKMTPPADINVPTPQELAQTLTSATQAWASFTVQAFQSFNELFWSPAKWLAFQAPDQKPALATANQGLQARGTGA